jgi:23S rRNA (adenine2503-C2)-methyltransferase
MVVLQAMTPEALSRACPPLSVAEARKVVSAVHRGLSLEAPLRGVRRVSLDAVRAVGYAPSLRVVSEQRSAIDPFLKLALETHDARIVEAVRIPLERGGRFSACVSSQVGCALACAFCATGRLGLLRNLETWEIVEQVRAVRATIARDATFAEAPAGRVHGVVFQGMGEPLANLDSVLEAIAVLSEPSALAIDARAITVCTAGLPSGIRRLAREAPKVRLGWSIGSARGEVRRSLMPIAKSHAMDEVFDAVVGHARETRLAPMWAVTLLSAVNDTAEDARELAAMAKRFEQRAAVRPRITVIPYNSIDTEGRDPFARASEERERAFRDVLRECGVFTHKRYSGGGDVSAACGQLAGRASQAS